VTLLHRLASVLRWIVYRNRAETDLDDELRTFVDMAAADQIRNGATPEDARRLALMHIGGIEQTKEHVRTGRHGAWLDEIGRDARYAVRNCAANPGFTIVVVLTLALGIGANTAIFSLIDALMLRSLPVLNPQQLVQVKMGEPTKPAAHFSYPIARALANRDDIFSTAAGFSAGWSFNVGSPGSVVVVRGALVTGAFYETLGLTPAEGRLLARADDELGAPLVAVISHGYWERQYASRRDIIGHAITISGVPVTIIGVSPRGFVGANVGEVADITMPVAAIPQFQPESAQLLERGNVWLRVLARPASGLSLTQATARLDATWRQISSELIAPGWPAFLRKQMADAVFQLSPGGTGWTSLRDQYTRPLIVLMAVVSLVLLIACANVASLLLARASSRQREIAVRLAIGAGRARIVRQLLIESTLVSLIGAVLGVALAWFTGRFLVTLISSGPFSVYVDLSPNWHVLGFTMALGIATALAFGTAPALQATAAQPSSALRADSRTTAATSRLLPLLVSGQVALSLVLLVGAGLFVRTLQNLQAVDPGFSSEGVLLVDLNTRPNPVPMAFLDDLRQTPGVVSASMSTHTPFNGATWSESAVPAGQQIPERENALFVGAAPGFFATMQIRLLAGREFSDSDTLNRPTVAIVNRAYAQRFFPDQNPVGQHLSAMVRGERKDLTIVGLAESTLTAALRLPPRATVYVAYAQLTGNLPTTIAFRVAGPPAQTGDAIRRLLQTKLPSAPIDVRPLSTQVSARMTQERMMATLASGFGMLAVVLACIGLYGLLACGVARRIKEIGVRMALGAERGRVMTMVAQRAARLVLVGIVVGLPAALAASRWIQSMLFGLKSTDLLTIAGAIGMLILSAQVAAYIPAWRASRVDPLAALRHE
jgi:putative ABC transport system permease protein